MIVRKGHVIEVHLRRGTEPISRLEEEHVHSSSVPHRTVPSLSGAVFLRNEKMFREAVGDAVVDRARASLTEEQRDVLDSAVPAAWIPVTVLDTFYYAIGAEAGRDLHGFYPEVVKEGITATLRSVWRVLLRLTSDRALLRRTPLIYERGHSVGKITPRIDGPGRATVVLTQWPQMPDLRRLGVASGIRAVMEVAGRKDVTVEYDGTDDGAVYRVCWRV